MSAERNASCPRCGQPFHCGAHDSVPCPCGTLTLTPELTQQLRERYAGCLCLACLAQLQGPPTQPPKAPTNR